MDRRIRINKLLILALVITCSNYVWSAEILSLSLFPINAKFKIEQIASASDYILFKHLNKNLIDIDENGRIYGDLAQSWRIEKNHSVFTIKLKESVKFSDGSPITPKDVKYSFDDLISKHGGIHYDFSNINKITILNNLEILIELKKSTPRFLRNLVHPEFGIRKANENKNESYDITSGCYKIANRSQEEILLEKNNTCDDFNNQYKTVSFSFVKPTDQKNSLLKKNKDFYIALIPSKDIAEIVKMGDYQIESPHIGFTYWLTMNLSSKAFNKKNLRDELFMIFNKNFNVESEPAIERAQQLYLPNGPGRLSQLEIDQIVSKKDQSKKVIRKKSISVLLPATFEYNAEIIKILNQNFEKVTTGIYSNQQEFIDKKTNNYDLYLTNNDFSSLDLYENISVTFNPIRPLIFKNKKITSTLEQMKETADEDLMFDQYKKIATSVLDDSLIIPLVHKKVVFLRKKEIDISKWSVLFPEISAWKIKVNK